MKRPFQFWWLSMRPSPSSVNSLWIFVASHRGPQADAFDVVDGHQHGGVVRHHAQLVEPAGRPEDGLRFDPLDDAEPMIRVNDLVTDLKCHVSPVLDTRGRVTGEE